MKVLLIGVMALTAMAVQGQQPQPAPNQPALTGKSIELTDTEKFAVKAFNDEVVKASQEQQQLQEAGNRLLNDMKKTHNVTGPWTVGPDGKTLVEIKNESPKTANKPAEEPKK